VVIFFSILILISITTYFWSKSIYIEQIEKNISQNIDALSVVLKNLDDIDTIIYELKKRTQLRITIIDETGLVVAESDKDKKKLGNHSNRYEVIHAKYDGIGKSIRYSKTIKKDLVYVAKKVTIQDKIYYIRMADYLDTIHENFIKLTLNVIPIFALFLIMAFYAAYFISKRIKKETDNILGFLIQLTRKEDLTYISSTYTQEFDKIARLLKKVAIKLAKKDKQKAKQTAKLKLANKQKDEIISAISHEFKNPIAIISGYSETILNDTDMPSGMKDKFLNKIHTSANKLSHIIDRLRLALKLDEGKEVGNFCQCSLQHICQEVISDLNAKYKERNILITGEDSTQRVDDTLFSMAISNLVENALKYSEDDVIIHLDKTALSITDKGIGIEQNELLKITQKFYRVSKNGWNNSLGLGLNIVLNILKLHQFELEIESKFHEGSTFTIKF
jgi:signal transduction histidine kinase